MKFAIVSTGIFVAMIALPAVGATMQDMPVLDPSGYSRPMVMHGALMLNRGETAAGGPMPVERRP